MAITDQERFRAMCNTLDAINNAGLRTKSGDGRETTEETRASFALQIRDALAGMPDVDLLAAYRRTDGEPGNPEADALLAEIERRGIDV